MDPTIAKGITRRLYDEMNRDNVDALYELLHPDYSEVTELSPVPLTRDSAVAITRVIHSAVPGLHRRVLTQVAEGNVVVDRVEYSGTSVQEFRGFPAGTSLTFEVVLFYRIEDELIREVWSIRDRLAMYEQAGVQPDIPKKP